MLLLRLKTPKQTEDALKQNSEQNRGTQDATADILTLITKGYAPVDVQGLPTDDSKKPEIKHLHHDKRKGYAPV